MRLLLVFRKMSSLPESVDSVALERKRTIFPAGCSDLFLLANAGNREAASSAAAATACACSRVGQQSSDAFGFWGPAKL